MARCSVKKLQLTFLDVNQISFKIYNGTWKPSLCKNESPLAFWVVPKAVGSHMAKKGSSFVYQFRRQLVFATDPPSPRSPSPCQPW